MSWADSDRRARLPGNWRRQIRPFILHRDPTCRLAWPGCTVTSTEVDHITPGDNHHPSNLQGLCTPCHKAKTQTERPQRSTKRTPEPHPGITR